MSSWGSWGSCNAQCEKTGTRTRTRTITTQVSCNGSPCPGLTQYNSCNGPCCARNCVLSSWTAWSSCNAPAGRFHIHTFGLKGSFIFVVIFTSQKTLSLRGGGERELMPSYLFLKSCKMMVQNVYHTVLNSLPYLYWYQPRTETLLCFTYI